MDFRQFTRTELETLAQVQLDLVHSLEIEHNQDVATISRLGRDLAAMTAERDEYRAALEADAPVIVGIKAELAQLREDILGLMAERDAAQQSATELDARLRKLTAAYVAERDAAQARIAELEAALRMLTDIDVHTALTVAIAQEALGGKVAE